jgi:hypothetical protein
MPKCCACKLVLSALAILCSLICVTSQADDLSQELKNADLRLNQIQVIGTHNSYHIAPEPKLLDLIGATSERAAKSIDYTHSPLAKQFSEFGIRQIELDVFADPSGGLYSKPVGMSFLGDEYRDQRINFDFQTEMTKPGMKIIHSPGFDYATTVPSLVAALKQVVSWSNANAEHVPILILIELKESVTGPAAVKPIRFTKELLDAVDEEIRSVVPAEKLLTPDSVRDDYKSLRDAVLDRGWPKLSDCKGKIFFAMDNEGALPTMYTEGYASLERRAMFVSVPETNPAAAWMKINDPIADFERIQAMVAKGFLVRTRADSETKQSRLNDTAQRERAFASGAQFVSTDYPVPDARFSTYSVRFENNAIVRVNPVSGANRR